MDTYLTAIESVLFAVVLLYITVLCGYALVLRSCSKSWIRLGFLAIAGLFCLAIPVWLYLGSPNVRGTQAALTLTIALLVGSLEGCLASMNGKFKLWAVISSPVVSALVVLAVYFLVNRTVEPQELPGIDDMTRIVDSFISLILICAIPSVLGSLLFQLHCKAASQQKDSDVLNQIPFRQVTEADALQTEALRLIKM
jgi:hypothetical protein